MIFVEDNTIKLNGVVLPGLVKSIEVKESAQIDEQEVEGSSTKPKQATGYGDAPCSVPQRGPGCAAADPHRV